MVPDWIPLITVTAVLLILCVLFKGEDDLLWEKDEGSTKR